MSISTPEPRDRDSIIGPKRLLGVLAGNDVDLNLVRAWADSADVIIAADGGANLLHSVGARADITVGDLDSLNPELVDEQAHLIHDLDQDTTDIDKLLNLAEKLGYVEMTLIGVEGDLLDHVLGGIQSSARSSLKVRLGLRRAIGHILKGPIYDHEIGSLGRVSVIPITTCYGVTLTNVDWPLEKVVLAPLVNASVSNKISGDAPLRISFDEGALIVFVEANEPVW